MSSRTYIRISEGESLLEVKHFQQDQIVIGHNASVNIDLKDETVSPIHAMIEKRGGGFYLCDLGSEEGTLKNGEKIIDAPVVSGDRITIGPYSLEFFIGEAKPTASPPVLATGVSGESAENSDVPKTFTPVVASTGAVIPEAPSSLPRKKKGEKTFAPPSAAQDVGELLGNSRGSVVEVVVSWKERIIDTFGFSKRKQVVLGGHEQSDIYLPVFGNKNIQHTLLDIGMQTVVLISPNMTGELIADGKATPFVDLLRSGRLARRNADYALVLGQGETVRAELPGNTVTLHIRYVPNSPKPLLAPILDLNMPEMVSLATAVFVAFFLSLYVSIKVPEDDKGLIELAKPRRAKIFYNTPLEPPVKKEAPVKKVVEMAPLETTMKQTKKPPSPKKRPKKVAVAQPKVKKPEGRSARIRPKNLPQAPKKVTSIKTGGQQKIAKRPGASAATVKKDISKIGILGVFGNKGVRDQLDKTASGVGVLQGLADQATGGVGEDEDARGKGIGTELLDTGAGGQGVSTIGIENVSTKGKGSGNAGYGTGGSLGAKKNVEVKLGDDESDFIGKIDKEAIRRVVMEHIREVRRCYERQLNIQTYLEGKIVLQWMIGEQGRVSNAKVRTTTMNSPEVERCLVVRLSTWKFPEPPEGMQAEVSYPFLFASQK